MQLSDFLKDVPKLHTWDNGETWNTGGFEDFHFVPLHYLLAELPPLQAFIETGAGNSTIFFLLHDPSRVLSIAPDASLFDRIRNFCSRNGVPTGPLQAHVDGSEWVLPHLAKEGAKFDFALIDGDHSLERTIIDFFYMNHMLKSGGLLMIDDLGTHAAKEVVRLIREEPDFEPVLDLRKALVFRKRTDRPTLTAWCDQAYIKREIELFQRLPDPFKVDRPSAADIEAARRHSKDGTLERMQAQNYRAIRRL
jgi:Methyltransferase domain